MDDFPFGGNRQHPLRSRPFLLLLLRTSIEDPHGHYRQMVASFSPHRETGGTLHLPSPSGIHHDHTSSALNQLRRSLSRSPSKGSDFRPFSPSPLHSPSPKKTHLVSSFSPSRRAAQQGNKLFSVPPTNASPTAASPCPSSPKFQRPVMRRNARTNPSSPTRRVLNESRDHGNAVASPTLTRNQGDVRDDENILNGRQASPAESSDTDKSDGPDKTFMVESHESLSFTKPNSSRVEKRRSFCPHLTSSPLKRSDGIMNLDQVGEGSPSAKRRSLHGATSFPDFDIFDSQMGNTPLSDSANPDNDFSASIYTRPPPEHFATVPKRSSSLRKSTLQQRQSDRSLFGRAKGNPDSDAEPPIATPMFARCRQRMSLDSSLFQSPDVPDAAPASSGLPGSSTPFLASRQNTNGQSQQSVHPLSKTMTQSSSSSSFVDDSPTHEATVSHHDGSKPLFTFSKSLPAGSSRPLDPSQLNKEASKPSPDPNFATPESYRSVKPLPAAFMSTGLISKKNRNAADVPNASMGNKNMPDTPCKRTANLFPVHKTRPQANDTNAKPGHAPSHSWTPLHPPPPATTETGTPFAKDMGIFGSSIPKHPLSRRSSLVSIDGDDQSQSPPGIPDAQFPIESDLPPTPTKQVSYPYNTHVSRSQSHVQNSSFDFPSGPGEPNSKLSLVGSLPSNSSDDSDDFMDDSPSTNHCHRYSRHKPPLSAIPRSRPLQCFTSQYSQQQEANSDFSFASSCRSPNTKLSTASPLNGKSATHASPHTPQDHIFPPDPSGLSISARNDRGPNLADPHLSALPATPTGPREYFPEFGKRHSLPLAGYSAPDVDSCLTSRFDKVELIGTGEFSQVYRVTEKQQSTTTPFASPFCSSTQTPSSNIFRECVWAVKKTKQPYTGLKDRERRNNEVEVLKTLGTCDYVVSFANSWEYHNHLYIQTEFCEEGSLDVFLSQVGLKARLDDFRIWKILLELSLVSYFIYYVFVLRDLLTLTGMAYRASSIFMTLV